MAKGNDGSAARRRATKKLLIAAGCSLVIVCAIVGLGGGGPAPMAAKTASTVTGTTHSHSHSHHHHLPEREAVRNNNIDIDINNNNNNNNNQGGGDDRNDDGARDSHRRHHHRHHRRQEQQQQNVQQQQQQQQQQRNVQRQYREHHHDPNLNPNHQRPPIPPHRFEERGWHQQQHPRAGPSDDEQSNSNSNSNSNDNGNSNGNNNGNDDPGQRRVRKLPKWQHRGRGNTWAEDTRTGTGTDDGGGYFAEERRMAGGFDRRRYPEGGGGAGRGGRGGGGAGRGRRNRAAETETDDATGGGDSRDEHEYEYEYEYEHKHKHSHERAGAGAGAAERAETGARYRSDLLAGWGSNNSKLKQAEAKLEGILNGSVHLVGISSTYNLKHTSDGTYGGVTGTFCKLDFSLHKNDPSKYPMFRFLMQASPECEPSHQVSFDLQKVAYLARERDREVEEAETETETITITAGGGGGGGGPKVLNLTAVAFHESRCGSTLVANSMIAMDPQRHRAYSESSPPVNAFHICGDYFDTCTREQAAAILRDTIYLMSRTDDQREERVFFKFQSITSKAIPTFQLAFPDVPWMYVYRDPVQVMMSHVKDDPSLNHAICTKTRRRPPREIKAIAKRHGRSGPEDLEPSEYCAAHLAQLTEAAVENLNDMAIPVPYDRLPAMMWESIMPKIFGRPLEPFEIDNLERISKSYSKQGKGKNKNKQGEFRGDSEQKEKKASDAIRKAAEEFLKESFDQLGAFESKVLE